MKHTAWGIVIAAGKDEIMAGGVETPFLYLNDRPVLAYSLMAMQQCTEIEGVVVVIPAERAEGLLGMIKLFGFSKVRKIVGAKAKRGAFMADALGHVDREADAICVQEAAHPLATAELVGETVKCARRQGNGIAAVPLPGAVLAGVKRNAAGTLAAGAGEGWMAVWPQSFRAETLRALYADRTKPCGGAADEVSALLARGEAPRIVPVAGPSVRLCGMGDMETALALVKASAP
jgi:2-C-methyl-D-erythritol 4-phosphate cytidylyltransferase